MVQGVSNNPMQTGGALLNSADPAAGSESQAKFSDVWNQIQAQYGAKPEKPKEIKKVLGKDDFLRIMITQMRHQDPTRPFNAEQFATELAQFTSVEQMQNMNQNISKLANQGQPLERLAMTNLIGKTVTVDRERFPYTENSNETISFILPKDASQVRVAVIAENGETVAEKDMGALKSGENSFIWDGKKANTLPAKSGNYTLRIEAQDEHGQPFASNSRVQARVVGLSFEGAEAVLLIGDPNRPEKVTMRNVIRIDSGTEGTIPGAQPLSAPRKPVSIGPVAAESGPNFFTFQKGLGSKDLDSKNLSPDVQQALQSYEQAQQEKGFPNGLQDADSEKPRKLEKGGD
jgi:flagellar basal-body rod modification protein FlgD